VRVQRPATLRLQVPDQHRGKPLVFVARSCQDGPSVVVCVPFQAAHPALEASVRLIERLRIDSPPLWVGPGKSYVPPFPLMLRGPWQGHVGQEKESAIGSEGFRDDSPLVA
jgi:hypothetical protein